MTPKRPQRSRPPRLDVIQKPKSESKVDVQYALERKIIELLLLYGGHQEEFVETLLAADEHGAVGHKAVSQSTLVYQKIYLDLQEDEIEFTPHSISRALLSHY